MEKHIIQIDYVKCVGCGKCADICPSANIKTEDKKARVLSQNCVKCGHCAAICPNEAITLSGYDAEIFKNNGVRLNPDEVVDVIRFRRSIRKFEQTKVPDDVVRKILEAGALTHTGKNMQDVSFTVIEKELKRAEALAVRIFRKIKPIANIISPIARRAEIDDDFFFFKAPLVIVISAKDKINGILASQNMEFVAEAYGLGVLFSGFFTSAANSSHKLKKLLKIPRGKRIAATLVIGYPKVKFLRSAQREKPDVSFI